MDLRYILKKEGGDGLNGGPGKSRWIHSSSLPGKAGWKLWYDWQIPRLVKKYRPDWVMTTGGVAAAVKIPQICWMPGDAGMKGEEKGLARLSRKRLAGSLRAFYTMFCFSADAQQFIKENSPEDTVTPVVVIPPAAGPASVPLGFEEREKAKETYAGGKEYFFTDVTGAGEEDLVSLLRAFSRFKKRQLSNMQMVLAGKAGEGSLAVARAIDLRLETYKYRQDLHQYKDWFPLKDGPAMTGGAYAIVRPFGRSEPGLSIVEAWKSRVPVIDTTTDARRLIGKVDGLADAEPVLYAAAGDPGSLAEKLMMIYKDEALRSSLVERGGARAADLDWTRTAGVIWAVLSGPKG